MTQNNNTLNTTVYVRAYIQFSVIGVSVKSEDICTLRLFASHEAAIDYARDLIDEGYDYAYVMEIGPDGVPDLAKVTRVADTEPSLVNLK